jgi:putative ABC transport system permease protein
MVMARTGTFIALVISIGAIFGGMNTMYSAVANRRREIGILRALGFGGPSVLAAFLLESITIALLGGLVGLLLGFGLSMIPVDLPFLSQSPGGIGTDQIWQATALVLSIGILGGGLPAIRASRLRVIAALR